MLYAVPVGATIANGTHREASTRPPPRRCPACARSSTAATSARSFRGTRRPDFDGSLPRRARARRSRTTSSATTASTSRSPSPTRSSRPRPPPTRSRVDLHAPRSRTSTTDLEADDEPKVAERARRRRGGVRRRAGQARRDLRHRRPRRTTRSRLHATIAVWDGDDADAVRDDAGRRQPSQRAGADARPAARERARHPKFLGSGFGGKLWPWTHCAARRRGGARSSGSPVKLVVSRKMMFQTVGHRPRTEQRMRLGATSGRQARLAPARLRQPHVDPRRLQGELRRGDAASCTACRTCASPRPAPSATSARPPPCAAPARCPASTPSSRR